MTRMTMTNDKVAWLLLAEQQTDLMSSSLAGVYHDHVVRHSDVFAVHDTVTRTHTHMHTRTHTHTHMQFRLNTTSYIMTCEQLTSTVP